MHTLLPIPEKINRVLTAGMLLWAAIWSLQGTAFSQARGSSPRSASAAHVMLKSSKQKGVAGMFLDFIKTPAVTDHFRTYSFAVPSGSTQK